MRLIHLVFSAILLLTDINAKGQSNSSWIPFADVNATDAIGSRTLEEVFYRLHRNSQDQIVPFYLFLNNDNSRVLFTPDKHIIIKTENNNLLKSYIIKVLIQSWDSLYPPSQPSTIPTLYAKPKANLPAEAANCLNNLIDILTDIPDCIDKIISIEREESQRDSIFKILNDISKWDESSEAFYQSEIEWVLKPLPLAESSGNRLVLVFGNRIIFEVELLDNEYKSWLFDHLRNKKVDGCSASHDASDEFVLVPKNTTGRIVRLSELVGCECILSKERDVGAEKLRVKLIKPHTEKKRVISPSDYEFDYYKLQFVNEEIAKSSAFKFLQSGADSNDVNSIVFCPKQITTANYNNLDAICSNYLIAGNEENEWFLIADIYSCSGCEQNITNNWKFTVFNSSKDMVRIKDGTDLNLLLSSSNNNREKIIDWLNDAMKLANAGRLKNNEIEYLGQDGIIFRTGNSDIVLRDSNKEVIYKGAPLDTNGLLNWFGLFARPSAPPLKKSSTYIVLDFFTNICKGKNSWLQYYRQNPLSYLSNYCTIKSLK